ncbi:MAG: FG-GAP repeat domain-containing protein, partial [Planctomycetota bacterium]
MSEGGMRFFVIGHGKRSPLKISGMIFLFMTLGLLMIPSSSQNAPNSDALFGAEFGAQIVISSSADGALSVYAADVDGDGDMDVLSASYGDDKIAWYESDGGSPPTFIEHVISTTADGAHSVYAADVDGDGYMDVLS